MRFYDLVADESRIQVMCQAQHHVVGDFAEAHTHRADIVGIRGFVGKSKRGELSIFPREIKLLSPCLHMIPKDVVGLKDQETRYRKRYLDLLVNPDTKTIFLTRAKIVSFIRQYLESRGFID